MKTPTLPLTISSQYFDDTKVTRSINPQTLKKYVSDFRRGDGDSIIITDADGDRFDLVDFGSGLKLVIV